MESCPYFVFQREGWFLVRQIVPLTIPFIVNKMLVVRFSSVRVICKVIILLFIPVYYVVVSCYDYLFVIM